MKGKIWGKKQREIKGEYIKHNKQKNKEKKREGEIKADEVGKKGETERLKFQQPPMVP